jgi:hypothetical protein
MSAVSVGAFHAGDHVLLVLAPDATEIVPVATALIAGNQ